MSGIIRAPRPEKNYTEVANAVLRDARLTYRARGILVRLLSNADGYRMTAIDLAAEGPDGRCAVLSALRELRRTGYIVNKRAQDERGRWSTETYVYDTPHPTTEVQFPNPGKSAATEVQSPNLSLPNAGPPNPKKQNTHKNNHHPHTPSTAEAAVDVPDIDDMINAAVWATRKIRPIRSEQAFRAKVRARILAAGPTHEDLATLIAWRTARTPHTPPPVITDPPPDTVAMAAGRAMLPPALRAYAQAALGKTR